MRTARTQAPRDGPRTSGARRYDRRRAERLGRDRRRARGDRLGRGVLAQPPARRPRPRPRAVRARPRQRRGQDHSRIIRLSYHRPRLRPARPARLRDVGGGRARERHADRDPDRRPRRRARATRRSRSRDYSRRDDRRGRPVRAARRRRRSRALAAVAARRRAPRAVPGGRRDRRPEPRQRGPPGGSRRAHGATLLRGIAGDRAPRRWRTATIEVDLADGDASTGPARSSSRPTPGRTTSSRRSTGACR